MTKLNSKIITQALKLVFNKVKNNLTGKNASYIPVLKNAPSNIFGITIVTATGEIFEIGDTSTKIAIESIAKVFTLCLALEENSQEVIMNKIGVSQSFLPFNSILGSEIMNKYHASTINPYVNAGAIATTSLITGINKYDNWMKLYNNMNKFAGRRLDINEELYLSELRNSKTNKALAYLLASHDRFYGNIKDTLEIYTRQGSVMVSSTELAVMASTLANCGRNPFTNEQIISNEHTSFVLATMMSSGLYNYSGPWICDIGLPGKSGVGGGIIAILPGKLAIGVVSPKLDTFGNSVRGIETCKELSKLLNLNMFNTTELCNINIPQRKLSLKLNKNLKHHKLTLKSKKLAYKIDKDLFKQKIKETELVHKIITSKTRKRKILLKK